MAFSDLFSRRRKDDSEPDTSEGPVHPTKALARLLAGLTSREQPLLLDLGPVVGPNVNFFGEQLGCKIFVEDLFKDIDRHVREGRMAALPEFFATRFPQESETIDGILAWDVFDYIDKAAARELLTHLVRILRPDGVLLALFNASEPKPDAPATYTRYVVIDRAQLQHRSYAAARGKQRPWANRDIQRAFEPLRITEQFLLKTNIREVLFKKGQ